MLDIRVRVKGGGHVSQLYAIRQAIAKAIVAYYAKYIDASSALELKKKLVSYDRTLLIADPRRMEPKKFGGHGARARRQKRFVQMSIGSIFGLGRLIVLLPVTVKRSRSSMRPRSLFSSLLQCMAHYDIMANRMHSLHAKTFSRVVCLRNVHGCPSPWPPPMIDSVREVWIESPTFPTGSERLLYNKSTPR